MGPDPPGRVLLVTAYWRTNVTTRQIGPLFGVSHSAAHRVIDTLGPLLALAPVHQRPVDQVAIVDSTRLVIAGDPQPGNRNDTIVYRTRGIDQKLADGRSWPTAATAATPR
jgi:hypothetical protein